MNSTSNLKSETFLWRTSILGLSLLAFLLTYFVKDNAFFWDTIQFSSLHAHFYFENNFEFFFLPENMDSGHPPTFGMYIALMWKWFGRSLAVSHFAMLPFLIGVVFYLSRLGRYFFKTFLLAFIFVLLHLFDPCFLGQATMVSPDLVLVLFFLMSVYGIFCKKPIHLLFGIIGLCIISTRGMMTVAALFFFDFINFIWLEKKGFHLPTLFKKTLPYFPGVALGFGFLILHYMHTGWIGYHENSPWSPAFEKVDAAGFIKNVFILGWRLADFGRVFLGVIVIFILIKFLKNKTKLPATFWQLLLLFFCLIIFLPNYFFDSCTIAA